MPISITIKRISLRSSNTLCVTPKDFIVTLAHFMHICIKVVQAFLPLIHLTDPIHVYKEFSPRY